MDGMPLSMISQIAMTCQCTLKAPIGCVGVGLHSGRRVSITLRPAPIGHGIVFHRVDLGAEIPARIDHIADARLSTDLVHPDNPAARVGTIEHVMAALAGGGIDNAVIELDGPEVPILDGSASPFAFLIDCAGVREQEAPRSTIHVLRPVRVGDGEAFVELLPGRGPGLHMTLSIDFAAVAIGRQSISLRLTPEAFRHQLCRARTFALAEDIERLRAAGLARGGSLENAVVVEGERVLNPGGLRMADEFARHKLLDAVGDLALAGAPICGRFNGHRSGHALNARLVRALLGDPSAWELLTPEAVSAAA